MREMKYPRLMLFIMYLPIFELVWFFWRLEFTAYNATIITSIMFVGAFLLSCILFNYLENGNIFDFNNYTSEEHMQRFKRLNKYGHK